MLPIGVAYLRCLRFSPAGQSLNRTSKSFALRACERAVHLTMRPWNTKVCQTLFCQTLIFCSLRHLGSTLSRVTWLHSTPVQDKEKLAADSVDDGHGVLAGYEKREGGRGGLLGATGEAKAADLYVQCWNITFVKKVEEYKGKTLSCRYIHQPPSKSVIPAHEVWYCSSGCPSGCKLLGRAIMTEAYLTVYS